MERQMSLISAGAQLELSRAELQLLTEALRPLIEQAAATRDECVAMGLHEMGDAALTRQRDLERLGDRLQTALEGLDENEEG
jgi:hypothetical protein